MLAPLVGGLDKARGLSHEDFMYWLELADYTQVMRQLGESLSSMLSSPPPDGDDTKSSELRLEYSMDSTRLQCAIVREDRCFHLALDDKFGEQFNPPEAEHWWDAPGVHGG